MTENTPLRILLVDNERTIADTLGKILVLNGFSVAIVYDGQDALNRAKAESFDVLFTDVIMPGMNGIQAAQEIIKIRPACKVILSSGNLSTQHLLDEACAGGVEFEILPKPTDPNLIIDRLRSITQG
jgi:CheY-like chemotaxis protein